MTSEEFKKELRYVLEKYPYAVKYFDNLAIIETIKVLLSTTKGKSHKDIRVILCDIFSSAEINQRIIIGGLKKENENDKR